VRHFGDERFGEAEEPAAAGGGFAPGEGDLSRDAGAELVGREAGVGLFAALPQVKVDGIPGLAGGQGGLQVLQLAGFVDERRGTGRGRDRCQDPRQVRDRHARRQSHVGPLLAVHEPSQSGTCDN